MLRRLALKSKQIKGHRDFATKRSNRREKKAQMQFDNNDEASTIDIVYNRDSSVSK